MNGSMADRTNDIWNDDDEEDRPPKRHRLRSFLIFFLLLLAVLGVVLAAAWRDGTGLDILRRYFAYGRNEGDGTTGYVYDASSSNRFAKLGDTLAVLSDTSLSLVDGNGETVWSTSVKMEAPAISAVGDRAVAYDVGGTELYVLDEGGLVYQLSAGQTEPYIAATLNSGGELAVTARKRQFKAFVSVYDTEGNPLFTFKSSERFVSNAYVTDDGKYLAAVTLGQSGGAFASSLVLYDLTAIDPVASWDVGNGMCYDMGMVGGSLGMVCDDGLYFSSSARELSATYSYNGSYLREYDLHGENYAVLLLNRYRSGSVGRLVTVGADGQEIATLSISDEILSISASGRYIAVLYADKLVIYTPQLEQYASLTGTDYAREALAGNDGSALLLAAEHAVRFLP
jgi:hypothetical protein